MTDDRKNWFAESLISCLQPLDTLIEFCGPEDNPVSEPENCAAVTAEETRRELEARIRTNLAAFFDAIEE
ncbi:MAG: hypothetical protein LBP22_08715 [Deltaproteobacteria bacterium]|jgi:hypothetical protein|nr:hypothetical protein [Deltaproteobacteria bacterium]